MNTTAAPNPITGLLALLAQLPSGLKASSRETNHFELSTPEEPFWFDGGDLFAQAVMLFQAFPEDLDRLQLLLDLAAAAKAAEEYLQATARAHEALEELQTRNRLRNDADTYCYHLADWGMGKSERRPNPEAYGQARIEDYQ